MEKQVEDDLQQWPKQMRLLFQDLVERKVMQPDFMPRKLCQSEAQCLVLKGMEIARRKA